MGDVLSSSNGRVLLAILLMAAVTFSTRAFPFILFGGRGRTLPNIVPYLGKYLPPALICVILIYCFRNVSFSAFPFGLPELIASASVAGLHIWKRNTILSIFGGTGIYMVLVQYVFL